MGVGEEVLRGSSSSAGQVFEPAGWSEETMVVDSVIVLLMRFLLRD